jgi:peptidoglycan LD-endopeptidase LytH
MTRARRRDRGRLIPAFAACFAAGIVTGWWLRGGPPAPAASDLRSTITSGDRPSDEIRLKADPTPGEITNSAPVATAGTREAPAVDALRRRDLRMPIDGADIDRLKGMFGEPRGGGGRAHEAVDILAPRNTPIHAVENGTIEKLFTSKAGGLTLYQFDPTGRFCYYYAHLESYARGVHEGQQIARGDVIGYVGTSGNAPPNTPHLHFAIFELGPDRRWWQGRPIDPYVILRH